ncbi:MAG: isopentenyl phosphate kinase family protein [Chloroflexi bacterium]|nr:isopentenyl phosphate kinase family protein [Chloroflexota bacterium]
MIFLKLGGSLITDKNAPETARMDVLRRVAGEIAEARAARPTLRLLIGHGSGSFGHHVASRYKTHVGAASAADWAGFAEVWRVANRLNRLVVDTLIEAGLPVIAFPPSASAITEAGEITDLASEPITRALAAGLLPVVAGDVGFDRQRGSTIISTERVFTRLSAPLHPTRLLLAGVDAGVFADYPKNTRLFETLRPSDLQPATVTGSAATDVTGGMADKVAHALAMARAVPGLEVRILSGAEVGAIRAVLLGEPIGTLLLAE